MFAKTILLGDDSEQTAMVLPVFLDIAMLVATLLVMTSMPSFLNAFITLTILGIAVAEFAMKKEEFIEKAFRFGTLCLVLCLFCSPRSSTTCVL